MKAAVGGGGGTMRSTMRAAYLGSAIDQYAMHAVGWRVAVRQHTEYHENDLRDVSFRHAAVEEGSGCPPLDLTIGCTLTHVLFSAMKLEVAAYAEEVCIRRFIAGLPRPLLCPSGVPHGAEIEAEPTDGNHEEDPRHCRHERLYDAQVHPFASSRHHGGLLCFQHC